MPSPFQNLKRIGNACMEEARPQENAPLGRKAKGGKIFGFIPEPEREKTERSDGAGETGGRRGVQEQSSDGFPAGGRSRRR